MIHAAPAHIASLGGLPGIALILFVLAFIAIVAYVLIVPKPIWQRRAELPLDGSTTSSKELPHE